MISQLLASSWLVKEYPFDATGIQITAKIRRHLFDHIQALSADFFDRTNTGELMARIKDDIDRIGDDIPPVKPEW